MQPIEKGGSEAAIMSCNYLAIHRLPLRSGTTPNLVVVVHVDAVGAFELRLRERVDHVWDFNFNSFSNVVDVHMNNLRRKLGKGREHGIETVRGVGYRLQA